MLIMSNVFFVNCSKNKIKNVSIVLLILILRVDALVQRAIKECFRDCTVFTITNRINAIIDSNRIMVINNIYQIENFIFDLIKITDFLVF